MRCEKNKPQARTLITLWFCAQFTCLDLCCDSHNTINILKIFQVFTVSWSHCNKGIVNLPVRLKGNLKCIYGNRWLYGIMDLEQVYGCCFADKSLLTGVRLCLWCSVPTAISVYEVFSVQSAALGFSFRYCCHFSQFLASQGIISILVTVPSSKQYGEMPHASGEVRGV